MSATLAELGGAQYAQRSVGLCSNPGVSPGKMLKDLDVQAASESLTGTPMGSSDT
jgi:hypothetical protein